MVRVEHRIEITRVEGAPAGTPPVPPAWRLGASQHAGAGPSVTSSAIDAWRPTQPDEVVAPPIIDERAVRARLVALTRTHGPDPARDGLRMLESAVAASDELHRILAELDDLVGSGAGAASSEVHRLRIHAQQMLNSLRFQHSVSIDGSTLGDVFRGDIGSGDAQPDAAA